MLSGGEIPALALVDAVARRLPGALSEGSGEVESFSAALDGGLEYPHYTRPAEFRGLDRSGDPVVRRPRAHRVLEARACEERIVSDTTEREAPPEDGTEDNENWPTPEQLREPPAPPFSWPAEPEEDGYHHPLDRVTGSLPKRARVAVDWIVTIVGAVAIVLAIKAWVVNPYRIPSSSMEPTLHCARPAPGCEARFSDRVLANRFIYHFHSPRRGDVIVFKTPPAAKAKCGAGGTFVKRVIGLPGRDGADAAALRPGLRLHRRQAARRAVHPDAAGATSARPSRTRCPRATTS